MGEQTGYLAGLREAAVSAHSQARGDSHQHAAALAVRLGTIKALQAGGTYQVAVMNESGGESTVYDYVRAIPDDELFAGASVWLCMTPGGLPAIINCAAFIAWWGSFTGCVTD